MLHAAVLIIAAAMLIFFSGSRAFACTGFAAGKKASSDGSLIIGRTEDISAFHPKRFAINEAQHGEGMRRLTDPVNGFSTRESSRQSRGCRSRHGPCSGSKITRDRPHAPGIRRRSTYSTGSCCTDTFGTSRRSGVQRRAGIPSQLAAAI